MPVRLLDYEPATGVLYLNGHDTVLHAISTHHIRPSPRDENGWYSLRLQAPDGKILLLHHALTLRETRHNWQQELSTHSVEIFPNLVVDDVRALTDEGRVSRILFRLGGLRYFFYYRHAEPLLEFKATAEQVAALSGMRLEDACECDLFAPQHVYVMHEYPKFFSFRVDDRTYEVWSGGREAFGSFHKLDVEAFPIASIAFDQPVDLETALDALWEWRTFFAEMALLPLQAEEVSVQESVEPRSPVADLYMPGASRYPDFSDSYYKLHPAHLPLNTWDDRDKLAAGMQRWLGRSKERRRFRSKLYRVIERMNSRTDASDLVELASAVESLDELVGGELLRDEALDAIARAAEEAALKENLNLDAGRIRGILGNLKRPSLAARYERMGQRITPPIARADSELLSRSATRIRHASAHGGALDGEIQPRVSPTVQALTALCARFDLETSDIPAASGVGDRAMTKRRFDDALELLRRIEADARS